MASGGEDQSLSMQDLFASLRANGGRSYSATSRPDENTGLRSSQSYPLDFTNPSLPPQITTNNQSKSQSPGMSQSQNTLQPRAPGIVSPNAFPSKSATPNLSDQSAADRTANLLSLLKFTQPSSSQGPSLQNTQSYTTRPEPTSYQSTPSLNRQTTHGRGPSASDLVASFMGRSTSSTQQEFIASPPTAKLPTDIPNSSVSNPQEYLMQLLNRSKTQPTSSVFEVSRSQTGNNLPSRSEASVDKLSRALAETSMQKEQSKPGLSEGGSILRKDSPIRIFGTDSKETTPFEPQDMPKVEPAKESIFTYVNPFEQLAASSPRNAKTRPGSSTPQRGLAKSSKLGANGEGVKRKNKEPSPAPKFAASRRKLTPGASDIMQSIESPPAAALDDGRTPIEALIGIGAPTTDAETVAEALNGIGEQVSRQVEHALAQAVEADEVAQIKDEELDAEEERLLEGLKDELQEVAAEVKEELDQDENQGVLEEMMPESVAEAIKKAIVEAAAGDVDDPRGSEEYETTPSGAPTKTAVPVYNFPMKPFVSIDIKQDELCTRSFREEAIVEIARMKKEFDQIDRTLATASDTFIIYAIPKNGGLRIIRQEDGADRQVFRETHDRIFNVALSTAPPRSSLSLVQTSISTGISGTVYWTAISYEGGDCIQEENIEKRSLSFPPVATDDENTSGGQLKTRAKKSSRHPEVFAIGRGKSIQLVFPFHAQKSHLVSSSSVVDTENYFRDRNLRINTGKAGKDFTFSEDDTVITTLDKAGRLRFWDIRELMHESNGTASKIATNEVKTPLLTFTTAVAGEKCWPTSVLYVDKLRPYTKCIALRYIIVGMKQNHTLQLWDLGLGKAVQELNFPHENESDAICSVSYHPASGMIVVGHPSRNSVYFIHLSAPKYNLPPMSQAKFAQRLANKDSALPKPEATAIMSGMREYSFSSKGQLRSIDLLPISGESLRNSNSDVDPSLFELYVMHSKGATCLNIKKEDLGWSQDHKVMNPVDAEQLGQIEVRDLRDPQAAAVSEKSSVNGDTQPGSFVPPDTVHKGNSKQAIKASSKASSGIDYSKIGTDSGIVDTLTAPNIAPTTNGAATNGTEKLDKKKKKRTAVNADSSTAVTPQVPGAPDTYAAAATRAHLPSDQPSLVSSKDSNRTNAPKPVSTDTPEAANAKAEKELQRKLAEAESISLGISGDFLDKEFKKVEKIVSVEFSNVLNKELGTLYRRFDEDKRVQDAAGAAKQDAILRLVSSTLTDNVDKALSRIIKSNIEQIVVPSISEVTASTLEKKVPEHLTQQLLHTLPAQLKLALPEAVFKSLQHPDVLRVLSDQVTTKVALQVERQFSVLLNQTVLPSFQNTAIGAAQRMTAEAERRTSEQLKQVDILHREDSAKIDQLTTLVRGLSETVSAMAAAQSGFQSEILRLQQQNARDRYATSSAKTGSIHLHEDSIAPSDSPEPVLTAEQQELDNITTLMKEGRFEEGTIMWLQSKQQGVLFDSFFVNCNPAYLRQCQSLVTLSVGAAVTSALDNNLSERLDWLEIVLSILNPQDPDVREVAPRIMNVLSQRLESQYMRLAEMDHRDPVLQKIPPLARRAREIAAFIE